MFVLEQKEQLQQKVSYANYSRKEQHSNNEFFHNRVTLVDDREAACF
jgi:hypothetical protein